MLDTMVYVDHQTQKKIDRCAHDSRLVIHRKMTDACECISYTYH